MIVRYVEMTTLKHRLGWACGNTRKTTITLVLQLEFFDDFFSSISAEKVCDIWPQQYENENFTVETPRPYTNVSTAKKSHIQYW